MLFSTTFIAVLATVLPTVIAAPAVLHTVQTASGPKKEGSYIVMLKAGVSSNAHLNWLSAHPSESEVTNLWNSTFINGFSTKLDAAALEALRANPDVASIAEDAVVNISATVTQTNAPWGLSRLSRNTRITQSPSLLNFQYKYDSSAGNGVDIYIVDTGIFTAHSDFGGRARWGATFGGYANADGNGHGTHCAGIAAGSRFGVAKSARLVAVKVLSDSGSGFVSDIISGLNFVAVSAIISGRPAIASLSLGTTGGPAPILDAAVTSLVNLGIHVTVAAGNANVDARNTSPARAPAVITVGATTIADARASFSNFGPVVDIFAPGQQITSTWIGSTAATNTISGTSMSTPQIAGLVAYLIRRRGNMSPASMSALIKSLSLKNLISGLPAGTINALARNDIASAI